MSSYSNTTDAAILRDLARVKEPELACAVAVLVKEPPECQGAVLSAVRTLMLTIRNMGAVLAFETIVALGQTLAKEEPTP
jgi:hypothetical protein